MNSYRIFQKVVMSVHSKIYVLFICFYVFFFCACIILECECIIAFERILYMTHIYVYHINMHSHIFRTGNKSKKEGNTDYLMQNNEHKIITDKTFHKLLHFLFFSPANRINFHVAEIIHGLNIWNWQNKIEERKKV